MFTFLSLSLSTLQNPLGRGCTSRRWQWRCCHQFEWHDQRESEHVRSSCIQWIDGQLWAQWRTFGLQFSQMVCATLAALCHWHLCAGGVACTLGGIVLGSTGLIEHSTQYLSAALLMIGIGVSLLVISGAIWRLSLPDDVDDCPCFRRMETCRNCNSPHCTNRLLPGSYLYPEFQHRPPPPSYLTSLNEYAFVYHPSAHPQAAYATVRMNTPPPLYRSTYSLK